MDKGFKGKNNLRAFIWHIPHLRLCKEWMHNTKIGMPKRFTLLIKVNQFAKEDIHKDA